jgi:DNA polymerase III sliding clamp (beta) subunit (PCNA family)
MMVSGPSAGLGTTSVDNAIISFGEGKDMEKFNLREEGSRLFITQDSKDYAVVSTTCTTGELLVSFKATEDGVYTLSFNSENVEFVYLHLIDNLTGDDIDLLATPSYSFDAKTTDHENRFKLVFNMK